MIMMMMSRTMMRKMRKRMSNMMMRKMRVTLTMWTLVSSSMTARGFLLGMVDLESSIAARELSSLHLEGEEEVEVEEGEGEEGGVE